MKITVFQQTYTRNYQYQQKFKDTKYSTLYMDKKLLMINKANPPAHNKDI